MQSRPGRRTPKGKRPFELLVSSSGGLFAADRGARAPGRRGEVCVGGEVAGGRKGAAVADLDEDPGSGPTPTPGIDVRTFAREWASTSSSICPASSLRWSSTAIREAARPGTTSAAASVPGTVTLCSSNAVKISSTSRSAILGAFGRSRVTSRRQPALRIWAGDPNRSSSVRTAGCCNRGPSTPSDDGWIWVSRPCGRLAGGFPIRLLALPVRT